MYFVLHVVSEEAKTRFPFFFLSSTLIILDIIKPHPIIVDISASSFVIQGFKKVLSSCLGQVDIPAGQVNFSFSLAQWASKTSAKKGKLRHPANL